MTETRQIRLTQIFIPADYAKQIVKPGIAKILHNFLVNVCNRNALIINTSKSLEVYHFKSCQFTSLAKKKLTAQSGITHSIIEHNTEIKAFQQFEHTLTQLAKHPQSFLIYCKKFAYRIKKERINPQIVWKFFNHFDEILKKLVTTSNMPHIRKVKEITFAFKEISSLSDQKETLDNLISDFKSNQNFN